MSGNPLTDPRLNLEKLPSVKDRVPKDREPLPVCSYKFIDGDFVGLRHLADDLYWFAWQCDHEVKALSHYVEHLIGDGGSSWDGATATTFRNAYGQDAININAFARMLCQIARIVDQLGLRLAKLELFLEEKIAQGISNGNLKWVYNTVEANSAVEGSDVDVVLVNPGGGWVIVNPEGGVGAREAGFELKRLYDLSLETANGFRKNAKTELAALTAPLSKALNWYLTEDEYDSGGLLSPSQVKTDTEEVKKLQKDFADNVGGLTADDFKKAVQDITSIGGDVQTVGDLVGKINGLKGATLVKGVTGGVGAVNTVGSVLTDLLMVLAVLPK